MAAHADPVNEGLLSNVHVMSLRGQGGPLTWQSCWARHLRYVWERPDSAG